MCFFLAAVGLSALSDTAEKNAERIGKLSVYGLIALAIGMLWLVKGYKLILAGINAPNAVDVTQGESVESRKGTTWLHISLGTGTIVLTLWLGLLAFSAFSDSVFPFQLKTAPSSSNPVSAAALLVLLAWWPYACWKKILERKPNTISSNVRAHKRVTMALGIWFTVILSVAVTFGIQNGNDRMTTAQVEDGKKDFQDVANKIGAIKSRDLKTTQDYIDAYAEMEPLLAEFTGNIAKSSSQPQKLRNTIYATAAFSFLAVFSVFWNCLYVFAFNSNR